jgi:hypothetical protein
VVNRSKMDDCLDWDDFEAFDDTTLIGVNLTEREMAVLRTAIFFVQDVNQWCDPAEYYSDVDLICETIMYLIRQT